MRFIGIWIKNLEDDEYPPPQELVGNWESRVKSSVVQYLADAIPKDDDPLSRAQLEYRHACLFGCGAELGSSNIFDSQWVWNTGLKHYVAEHNVMLPGEFLQHAMEGKDKPALSDAYGKADYTFWKEWCRLNRNHAYQDKIEVARTEAEALSMSERSNRLKANEDSIGLSTATCMYSGCDAKALDGKAFCAACDEKQATVDYRANVYSRKFQELFS